MSPQAQAIADLLEHIDKLKALHRANESPSFGQVERAARHLVELVLAGRTS